MKPFLIQKVQSMKKISHFLIFSLSFASTPLISSEYVAKIGIIVDKKAITERDIESRIVLILSMTQQEITKENKDKIRSKAIEMLIREQLQIKEVEQKLKKEGRITNEEINRQIDEIAKQNNMTGEDFLNAINNNTKTDACVDVVKAFKNQLHAQMAWARFVRYLGGHVTEHEIDVAEKKMKHQCEDTVFNISEIVLNSNKTMTKQDALKQAHDVLDQISRGVSFYVLAQQLSEARSSQNGGLIGKQTAEQINPTILKRLESMNVGDVRIFETPKGIEIIRLNALTKNNNVQEEVVDFKIAHINFIEQFLTEESYAEINQQVEKLLSAKSVSEFLEKAKKEKISVQETKDVPLTTIQPEEFKTLIKTAKEGSILQPVKTDSGLQIFCIAKKGIKKNTSLSRKEIENMLLFNKQSKIAEAYMNKLIARSLINHKKETQK
ncbi:MAG: Chaperone SurA [Holosporales bacterium]